jgi:hypothetical protein
MAQFYLYYIDGSGSSNTLDLDANVTEITLGGNKRRYKFLDYAGQSGAAVRGIGSYSKKTFMVSRVEKAESGDLTAWNSRRNDFMNYFTLPVYTNQWLYLIDGESSLTLRTQVYIEDIPPDKYKYYRISDKRSFKVTSPSGIWENTSSTTGSTAITGSDEQQVAITNSGMIETPLTIAFTPTAAVTEWRVNIAEGYGIKFSGTFAASKKVEYNMKTGKLTIDSAEVTAANYINSGSPFLLPRGSNTLYFKASGAGTFEHSYVTRYI